MKYGVVPSDVMPETYCANSTSQMRAQIATKLREDGLKLRDAAAKDCPAMKTEMLKEIYRMLVLCLGEPPVEFEWTRYDSKGNFVSTKTYTPKSFYNEYVGADLENNYIMVMNDPTREYGKVYEIDYDRHVYDGQNWLYINLPYREDQGDGHRFHQGQHGDVLLLRCGQVHGSPERYPGSEQLRLRFSFRDDIPDGQAPEGADSRQRVVPRDDPHRCGSQGWQACEVDG